MGDADTPQMVETNENSFEIIHGLYQDTFPPLVDRKIPFSLLFIDGNHQKKPTIKYFKALAKDCAEQAIFIFDDINYSIQMREA